MKKNLMLKSMYCLVKTGLPLMLMAFFLSAKTHAQCPTTINSSVFNNCDFFSLVNGTRTEIKVMNADEENVTYSTLRLSNGQPVGGNNSGTGQGNGNGLSVSFVPASDLYRITASKPGCTDITIDVNVVVPSVPVVQNLSGGGVLCASNSSANIILDNSDGNTTYILLQDGQEVSNEEQGNGSSIDFGSYSNLGNYSVKAWNCGSPDIIFGNLLLTDKISLPANEGFNNISFTGFPQCWNQETITGSSSLTVESSTINPVTIPQEGSQFIHFSSRNFPSGDETRLVSPQINALTSPFVNIQFYWYNENDPAAINPAEGVQVQYSLDGTNWTDAGSFFSRHNGNLLSGTGEWSNKIVTLPVAASNQPTVYIGFKFHAAAGNNMSLDNIRITGNAAPLPVLLETFSGRKSGSAILLNWKVNYSSPQSTVKFNVERSADGQLFNSIHDFTVLQSRCDQPFEYTDLQPLKGRSFYRIRITEPDGRTIHTYVVTIVNNDQENILISLNPSVIHELTTVKIFSPVKSQLTFFINDMQGRTLQKMTKGIDAGTNSMVLNLSTYSSGVYQLRTVTPDGKASTLLFIKQ